MPRADTLLPLNDASVRLESEAAEVPSLVRARMILPGLRPQHTISLAHALKSDIGTMWLSTRRFRRIGDPEWADYLQFIGLPHLQEIRTLDSWCNPCVSGNYPLDTLDQLWDLLDGNVLPIPEGCSEYYLLFTDALGINGSLRHPRLTLLGYDLSDDTWTSSLLNCGRWQGVLEPIAQRTSRQGLLSLEDAKMAQSLLPDAWNHDHHASVTIWSLFEVSPCCI